MAEFLDPAVLDRFLAGECTDSERADIGQLLRGISPSELVTAVRAGLGERYVDGSAARVYERLAALKHEVASRTQGERQIPRQAQGQFRKRGSFARILGTRAQRWGRWHTAAAVTVAVLVAILSWTADVRHTNRRMPVSMLTYTTGNGERATVTLPDGGTVALNVASRLEVPQDYMAGNRTVRLLGSGLFTVPHHAKSPLTVVAGAAVVRVLGTSFMVRHYAPDTVTQVAVRDGKVAVGATVMTANELVLVGRHGTSAIKPVDTSLFTFTTGVLTLTDMPLREALIELNRWYDADIRLGDQRLAERRIGGEFTAGSRTDLKMILRLTLNVHVVRSGRMLTLYPG